MIVIESNNMLVVRYDWKVLREKKRQVRRDRIAFMEGDA